VPSMSQGYWAFLYNRIMKQVIQQRIAELSNEIQSLHDERQAMFDRDKEIEVRLHQLVGAVYEMQQLLTHLDRQPSADVHVVDPEAIAAAERQREGDRMFETMSPDFQRSHQTSSGTDDQSKD